MKVQQFKFKFVIIGKLAVGKTSLSRAWVSKQFTIDYLPTIGTNVFVHHFPFNDETEASVSLFDIAGHERWSSMRSVYYKGSQAAFLVGDLTRPESFVELMEFWYPDFIKFCPNKPVILIANKYDLESKTDIALIDQVAQKINAISIVHTSAQTGENCEIALKKLVEHCIRV